MCESGSKFMKYNKKLEKRKKEIIAEVRHCERCLSEFNLTIDHIIPVEILLLMGFTKEQTYDEENFQVLCGKCNALKGCRLDFSNKKTKLLLIKYLNICQK
jgi:5-methylcytosine-specific restriction endonuclease McrA